MAVMGDGNFFDRNGVREGGGRREVRFVMGKCEIFKDR